MQGRRHANDRDRVRNPIGRRGAGKFGCGHRHLGPAADETGIHLVIDFLRQPKTPTKKENLMQEVIDQFRRDTLAAINTPTVTRCLWAENWADFWRRQRRPVPILDEDFEGVTITLDRSEYATH